ncbi:MAG: hypothetical protein ACE15D_18685 [Candidatus Eisenbacteria bacterium]
MGPDIRIVILQRGWVTVGEYETLDGAVGADQRRLVNAKVIRRWGTTKGLGELVDGPLPNTILDPAGEVRFHALGEVASIVVNAKKWRPVLCGA